MRLKKLTMRTEYVRLQEVIANGSIRRIKTGKSILFF